MKTALIILNYNNAHDTRNCIESIKTHNTADVKLIVVDNGSRPEELSKIKEDLQALYGDKYRHYSNASEVPTCLPEVTLVESGGNIGYGKGNNVGLNLVYADPEIDYVMVLNNDILFVEDMIPALIEKHKALADCAILSPVLYKKGLKEIDYTCARRNLKVRDLIKDNLLHYIYKLRNKTTVDIHPEWFLLLANDKTSGEIEIELPSGSCMLFDKNYFKSIGSFDPGTFMYYEENILYKKIAKSGKKNYLTLDHKCIHLGAATTTNVPNNKWLMAQGKKSEKYYVRNYSGVSPIISLAHKASVSAFMGMFILQKTLKGKGSK